MAELSKREKVYHVFQQISQTYDRANGRISLGMESRWKDCLIEAVCEQAAKGSRVLDVCSGTGDIAISLAAHRPDLKVTGLDFSPAMLDVARKKGAPLANVTWQEGDAMNLPFEDNTFSAACISFGLRNTSDYLRVLQEMTRVVVPGGWVYCLDSFVPDSLVIRPFIRCTSGMSCPSWAAASAIGRNTPGCGSRRRIFSGRRSSWTCLDKPD